MPLFYGGQGVTPSTGSLPGSNQITLPAGACWTLPNGWFECKPGPYSVLQELDTITGAWRTVGGGATGANVERIHSDGGNYRIANQTGCVVGVNVTNAGSGYTSAPTVAAAAGGAIFRAIVGGAVNTSVTVTNAGTNYTYPPIVVFSAPPAGGIQATGHATLSGATVGSVVVDNQGAGYQSPPTISFINDPREGQNNVTLGYNAAAVATLTGAGTITGVIVLDHGLPQTSVPALTFSGGGGSSAAGTAIMCWTITGYNVSATTAGSGYTTPVLISAYNTPLTGAANTNPMSQASLVKKRNAFIAGAVSGVAITATGQTVIDGGIYDQVPTVYVQSNGLQGASPVQVVFLAPSMGGVTDTSWVMPG